MLSEEDAVTQRGRIIAWLFQQWMTEKRAAWKATAEAETEAAFLRADAFADEIFEMPATEPAHLAIKIYLLTRDEASSVTVDGAAMADADLSDWQRLLLKDAIRFAPELASLVGVEAVAPPQPCRQTGAEPPTRLAEAERRFAEFLSKIKIKPERVVTPALSFADILAQLETLADYYRFYEDDALFDAIVAGIKRLGGVDGDAVPWASGFGEREVSK